MIKRMRHEPAFGPESCLATVRDLSELATLRPAKRALRCEKYKPEDKRLRPRQGFVPEPRPWEVDNQSTRQKRSEMNRMLFGGEQRDVFGGDAKHGERDARAPREWTVAIPENE